MMDNSKEKELLKRIAKLAKQNQELEELLKKLQRKGEKLIQENERAKEILAKVSPDKLDKELSAEQNPDLLNLRWLRFYLLIFMDSRKFQTRSILKP